MTEIERIKSEGWLPDNFFEEEVICEYKVDTKLKQIWAIELDMLKEFIRVCDKHHLRWYAIGGTVLGAVRHNGFIPWDDDIDVGIPREDYDKFKTLSYEFSEPYFFQSSETDSEYGYSFIKIRNSNTTWYMPKFRHCKFNQGIFLDVFPIDNCNKESYASERQSILEVIKEASAAMKFRSDCLNDKDIEQIQKYYHPEKSQSEIWNEIERIASSHKDEKSDYLSWMVFLGYSDVRSIWPKKLFDDYNIKDFYGIPLRMPTGWEEYLKIVYGDWSKYPPIEERGKWHNRGENCNPLVPYNNILHNI